MDTRLLSTDRPIAIYYTYLDNVNSITRVGTSQCSVSITGTWNLINTKIGSIEFTEESKEDAGGLYYNNALSATIPGHDINTPEQFKNINGRRVIIRLDYRNGLKKILGNEETNPRIFIVSNSNTTTSRELKAEFKSLQPCRFLQ